MDGLKFGQVGQVGELEEFLRDHAGEATRTEIAAYEEVLRLRRKCDQLERMRLMAEVRCAETQINALREHQNAWAMLMLCVKSGVEVIGFEALSERVCRHRIMELQVRLTDAIAKAQVCADRLGLEVRMGIPEGEREVRLRLQVKGEERASSRSVS